MFFRAGSPKYFGPLLHYLRSGVLEIPPGISRTALLREAEFYGLPTVITHIQHLEEEKRKQETPRVGKSWLSVLHIVTVPHLILHHFATLWVKSH